MSLHVESIGSGEPLLLIHGWGMHGGVWDDVARKLSANFRVHSVDLPGYGYSAGRDSSRLGDNVGMNPELQIDVIVDRLAMQLSEPLTVCGWSLGGQVALRWAARDPAKVRRLILVASTPCFAEREDWPFGMQKIVLEKFAGELEQDHAAILRRFITLQLRGSENERELSVLLRASLFSRGEPDMQTLRAGLSILRDVDLRNELRGITAPTLVITGERDRLTPPQASHYLAKAIPAARLVEIEGAAHAPFLSHPDEFVMQLKIFMENQTN